MKQDFNPSFEKSYTVFLYGEKLAMGTRGNYRSSTTIARTTLFLSFGTAYKLVTSRFQAVLLAYTLTMRTLRWPGSFLVGCSYLSQRQRSVLQPPCLCWDLFFGPRPMMRTLSRGNRSPVSRRAEVAGRHNSSGRNLDMVVFVPSLFHSIILIHCCCC